MASLEAFGLLDDALLDDLSFMPMGTDTQGQAASTTDAKAFGDLDMSFQDVDLANFDLVLGADPLTPAVTPSVDLGAGVKSQLPATNLAEPMVVDAPQVSTLPTDCDMGNPPVVVVSAADVANKTAAAPMPFPQTQPGFTAKPPAKKQRATKRRAKRSSPGSSPGKDFDAAAAACLDKDSLKEYLKKEERKKKNRIAAEKSRKKRKEIERREAAELAFLRVRTKEQQSEIAALSAENRTLKAQLEFFKLWVTRQPSATPAPGSTSPASSTLSQASNSAASNCDSSSSGDEGLSGGDTSCADSVSSRSPVLGPSSPRSDDSGLPGPARARVRFRARKRHAAAGGAAAPRARAATAGTGDAVSKAMVAEATAAAVEAVDNVSPAPQGGLRAVAIAGAAFAIVFTFVLSANLDGLAGQHMAVAGLGGGPMFQAAGISEAIAAAAADPAMRVSGRALHGLGAVDEAASGVGRRGFGGAGHLASHGHTLQGSMGWAHVGAMAGADAAASAAAFMDKDAPPVPQLWSPSAALTFMLYALGIKRFAEVVLVNALLLGLGVGLWTVLKKLKAKAAKGGQQDSKRRRRGRSNVTAKTAKPAAPQQPAFDPSAWVLPTATGPAVLPQYVEEQASRPLKRSRRDITVSA